MDFRLCIQDHNKASVHLTSDFQGVPAAVTYGGGGKRQRKNMTIIFLSC